MREIRTLRATWRGLETWCESGLPGRTGAPALDPTPASSPYVLACGGTLPTLMGPILLGQLSAGRVALDKR